MALWGHSLLCWKGNGDWGRALKGDRKAKLHLSSERERSVIQESTGWWAYEATERVKSVSFLRYIVGEWGTTVINCNRALTLYVSRISLEITKPWALSLVSQRGCGTSLTKVFQDLTEQSAGRPTLSSPTLLWDRGWNIRLAKILPNLNISEFLWWCKTICIWLLLHKGNAELMEINDDLKLSSVVRMAVDGGTTEEPCKIVWLSNKMLHETEWRKMWSDAHGKKIPVLLMNWWALT